jgi:hypothetical protein
MNAQPLAASQTIFKKIDLTNLRDFTNRDHWSRLYNLTSDK